LGPTGCNNNQTKIDALAVDTQQAQFIKMIPVKVTTYPFPMIVNYKENTAIQAEEPQCSSLESR